MTLHPSCDHHVTDAYTLYIYHLIAGNFRLQKFLPVVEVIEVPSCDRIFPFSARSAHVVTKLVVVPVVASSPSQTLMQTAALACLIADGADQ